MSYQKKQDAIKCIQELAAKHAANEELAQKLKAIETLHGQKLWHQITEKLEEVASIPDFTNGGKDLLQLYNVFISQFEEKLDPLRLAFIYVAVAKQFLPDIEAALLFLGEKAEEMKKDKDNRQAYCLLRSTIALYQLQNKNTAECKAILDEIEGILDSLIGAEADVYSAFYYTKALYQKQVVKADEFYKAGLMYLAYTPTKKINADEQKSLAVDLTLAALVGDNIYSYGELLASDILSKLPKEDSWLGELLKIFDSGDIKAYHELVTARKADLSKQKILTSNAEKLNQKISILSFTQLIFTRPVGKRILTFKEIADCAQIHLTGVENLVMKSLSLGLIRGEIDEVDQIVVISWVKPKVLGLHQIAGMRAKLEKWTEQVDKTLRNVEDATPSVLIDKAFA